MNLIQCAQLGYQQDDTESMNMKVSNCTHHSNFSSLRDLIYYSNSLCGTPQNIIKKKKSFAFYNITK